MQQYFFDFAENAHFMKDEDGVELSSLDVAKTEALRALGEFVSERLARGVVGEMSIAIRLGNGKVAYKATTISEVLLG